MHLHCIKQPHSLVPLPTWLPAASLARMQLAADQWCCAALRSGLTPLHPALRAPDVRQALAAQHHLHSSIFDSKPSSWTADELGHLGDLGIACDTYSLAAVAVEQSASQQPAHKTAKWLHLGSMADCRNSPTHSMELPEGHAYPPGSAWSPGGTHYVQALVAIDRQHMAHKLQLALLRMRDGNRMLYTVETLDPACHEVPILQVLWDRSASQERPRLAVVRGSYEKVCLHA